MEIVTPCIAIYLFSELYIYSIVFLFFHRTEEHTVFLIIFFMALVT